jgi:DNA-binding NarL/FixJ family response regulator
MTIVDQSAAASPRPSLPPNSRSGLRSRRRLDILLVEDDASDASLIGALLARSQHFECTVTQAPDLPTARAALAAATFDLTILDYWMGAEPSLALRDHPAYLRDGGLALLLSAVDVVDVRGAAMAAGARAYLHKNNLSPETLDAAIRDSLRPAD